MKKLFSAIDVGSYELCMKVFELGGRTGIREIDCVRHRIDLGNDTFHTGMISRSKLDELCGILSGFSDIMKGYGVSDYLAYGTSAIRETVNSSIVLDRIRERTGIRVSVLSNSEQRFLEYKGAAIKTDFDELIAKGTAIVDIGGGSTQVTLFSGGHLVTTVNLHLGTLRIRTKLRDMEALYSDYEMLIGEIAANELDYFKGLYLGDLKIENIMIIDDYVSSISGRSSRDHMTSKDYKSIMKKMSLMAPYQIGESFGLSEDNATLLFPSAVIIDRFIDMTGAKDLYLPGVSLSDGIAYDYADRKGYIKAGHDFTDDILSSAGNIADRYGAYPYVTEKLVASALAIFDATKNLHGLGKRERLLLRISAILRNCGKYVSMSVPAEVSYSIVCNSEIIGISHEERMMVALIVKNSYPNDISYDELVSPGFDSSDLIITAKLTAILRVAVGITKNTTKNMKKIRVELKEGELIIKVSSDDRMKLERGLFSERTDTFEEVFGITPVLRVTKVNK